MGNVEMLRMCVSDLEEIAKELATLGGEDEKAEVKVPATRLLRNAWYLKNIAAMLKDEFAK